MLSVQKAQEQQFKTKILSDSSQLATQNQLILSQEQAIKMGYLKLYGEIEKVQSQVSQKQKFVIDSVEIPFVPDNFADTSGWMQAIKNGEASKELMDSLVANSITVPKKFETNSDYFSISGRVNKENVLLDSVVIKNESNVTVGWKKHGFLNMKSTPLIEVRNTNPYLSLEKLTSVNIKPDKNLFKQPYFWAGVGIIAGILISK
jgi:hypothetical protein